MAASNHATVQTQLIYARMTANSKSKSSRLAAMHKSAAALHSVGVMGDATMRHFDALCLEPVVELASEIENKGKEKGESL